ncbi:hypothetical protein PTKIN_Ptkin08bG0007100 [Pterospermum kingtungense]
MRHLQDIKSGTIAFLYKNEQDIEILNCTDCAVCLEEFRDGDSCRIFSKVQTPSIIDFALNNDCLRMGIAQFVVVLSSTVWNQD